MTFTIRGRSRAALQALGIIAEDITIRETPVKLEAPEREATPGVMKVENDVVEIVDSEDESRLHLGVSRSRSRRLTPTVRYSRVVTTVGKSARRWKPSLSRSRRKSDFWS
jgi:hypothetical protein